MHLIGPEAQRNSDIVSAANDREQAGQVFKYLTQIIRLSPRLTNELKIIESKKKIVWHDAGSSYQAISADAKRKHGLNPVVVIYDELAQSINRELFDALETSQGAQECPLFITISTQSNDPQHPLSQMIDDGLTSGDETLVCHLYEVPEEVDDIFDEECWYGANPALGDFRLLPEMREYATKAKRLPSFENTFRLLYLNQRVSNMLTLFTPSLWNAREAKSEIEPGTRVYLGLDLATKIDLCALVMVTEDDLRMRAWFWKPEQLLSTHQKRDRVDYPLWRRQGFLEPCAGRVIDPEFVAMKIAELHGLYEIVGLAYDRWRIDNLIKELDRAGLDAGTDDSNALRLEPWGQGYKDMSPAIDAFEAAVVDEKLTHDGHPILKWNVMNAVVANDAAGNRKLDKEKSRLRIDGAVAGAMAMGLHARMMEQKKPPSVYKTRGIVRL